MARSIYYPFSLLQDPINYDAIPNNLTTPIDLKDKVELGSQIYRQRHPDYPEGIFFDTVKAHILRIVQVAELLELPAKLESQRNDLVRMLYVHDLAEIQLSLKVGHDTSIVLKEDHRSLGEKIDLDEDRVAKQILNKSDYLLYYNFERAKDFFDGKLSPFENENLISFIAKVIDIRDGEVGFYFYLTEWLKSSDFDGRLPTDRPYLFTMNRYEKYIKKLSEMSQIIDKEIVGVCLYLIHEQISLILGFWELVKVE
ncbi:MAG: hypothetical protein M3P33_02335, partial [bacterium]|nr:hypothetical protein [bacterium]